MRSALPLTYASRVAPGSGRGSKTGPSTTSSRAMPLISPATNNRPASGNATTEHGLVGGERRRRPTRSRASARAGPSPRRVGRRDRLPSAGRAGSAISRSSVPFDEVDHVEAVDGIVAGAAADEDDALTVGRHDDVARLAEREPPRARVLPRERFGVGSSWRHHDLGVLLGVGEVAERLRHAVDADRARDPRRQVDLAVGDRRSAPSRTRAGS